MTEALKKGISMVLLSYKEEENLRVFLPQIKERLQECGEPYEMFFPITGNSAKSASSIKLMQIHSATA